MKSIGIKPKFVGVITTWYALIVYFVVNFFLTSNYLLVKYLSFLPKRCLTSKTIPSPQPNHKLVPGYMPPNLNLLKGILTSRTLYWSSIWTCNLKSLLIKNPFWCNWHKWYFPSITFFVFSLKSISTIFSYNLDPTIILG